jgi:hypothetical protein
MCNQEGKSASKPIKCIVSTREKQKGIWVLYITAMTKTNEIVFCRTGLLSLGWSGQLPLVIPKEKEGEDPHVTLFIFFLY